MPVSEQPNRAQKQRVDVQPVGNGGDRVKISVERFDENLGWYTCNSLRVSRRQLPLLEQALQRVHRSGSSSKDGKIVPFEKESK